MKLLYVNLTLSLLETKSEILNSKIIGSSSLTFIKNKKQPSLNVNDRNYICQGRKNRNETVTEYLLHVY